MRIVLDTNVFISGIFWEGNYCSKIIELWKNGSFELVTSPEILQELLEVLQSFKIQLEPELIELWKNMILSNSIIVIPYNKFELIKNDLDDNKFLEAAFCGKADLIISQDKHLLKLKEFNQIKILKPEEAILFL